jgi:hypothetical protein
MVIQRIKIKYVLATFVLLFSSHTSAQDTKPAPSQKQRPDLGGRWALSFVKDASGKKSAAPGEVVMVVKHQEPEISVVENPGNGPQPELRYFTDGRGEVNLLSLTIAGSSDGKNAPQVNENVDSMTKWDGEKLVTKAHLRTVVGGTRFIVEIVKEWKLSKDGNTLTVSTKITNPDPNPGGNRQGSATGGWSAPTTSRRQSANPNSNVGAAANMAVVNIPFITESKEVYLRDTVKGEK